MAVATTPRGGIHRQVLVSHVDTALLVMGLDHDFQLRRLERYLALVRLSGVPAVLVLSKADAVAPQLAARRMAEAADVLPPHMVVLAYNLRQPAVAGALSAWLQPGQTRVLLGSSGAGKRTLANTLGQAHGVQVAQADWHCPRRRQPRPPHHHGAYPGATAGGRLHHRHPGAARAAAGRR